MIKQFEFEKTEIPGLTLIHPFIATDERGYFMKTFRDDLFRQNGIILNSMEDMTSMSQKGVIRGLHFQTKHSQDKLIRVSQGEIYDVALDLRKHSPTFGTWKGFYLSENNLLSLYIPSGFAHGFIALSDKVVFHYRCGQPYVPDYDSGILWNDQELGIDWPTDGIENIIISTKDKTLQTYKEFRENIGGL